MRATGVRSPEVVFNLGRESSQTPAIQPPLKTPTCSRWSVRHLNPALLAAPRSPLPDTGSWVAGFTNKIDAGNVARVTIRASGGATVTTTATADLDGKWQTGTVNLS